MTTPHRSTNIPALVGTVVALLLLLSACASSSTSTTDGAAALTIETRTADASQVIANGGTPIAEIADKTNPNGPDDQIGNPVPFFDSVDYNGAPTAIADNGRAKIIVFSADWCPHCQEDISAVGEFFDNGGRFDDRVDVVFVATRAASRPAEDADPYFLREWPLPVLLDTVDDTIATAYGIVATPTYVFVTPAGSLAGRYTGAIDPAVAADIAVGLADGVLTQLTPS